MAEDQDADTGYDVAVADCVHNNYDLAELGLANVLCLDCGAWWTDEPPFDAA